MTRIKDLSRRELLKLFGITMGASLAGEAAFPTTNVSRRDDEASVASRPRTQPLDNRPHIGPPTAAPAAKAGSAFAKGFWQADTSTT